MKSILITGVNRGLGLGLLRTVVKDANPPKHIIGTCRDIQNAKELQEIVSQHSNVHILKLDVRESESFQNFAEEVEKIVEDDGLDVLFNNAGYAPKSTRINFLKTDHLTETFLVNVVGPVMLTKSILPLLKRSAKKSDKKFSAEGSAVINMSTILSSIALNKEGGLYPYRCSKAALNMATKSLSVDLKNDGILVTCIHPGWVKTDMGGPEAPMNVEESVSQIVEFVKNLNESHNGKFYQFDGKELQW